ncbi:MAG: CHAT domain-containing protein [Prevotellaceae bacterium]|jgi:CHAT domain-containing protein|nr:CHAT domain-containing protein [Prevotellaceae bacterium]
MKGNNIYAAGAFSVLLFFTHPLFSQTTINNDSVLRAGKMTGEESQQWILKGLTGKYEYSDLPVIYESFFIILNNFRKFIEIKLMFIPEQERERYCVDISNLLHSIQKFSVVEAQNYPPLSRVAYECIMLNKGLLISLSNYAGTIKKNIKDPVLIELWGYIDELKRLADIAHGYFQSPQMMRAYVNAKDKAIQENDSISMTILDEFDSSKKWLVELDSTINEKEKELVHSLKDFSLIDKDLQTSWKDIKDILSENEVAVEFVLCPAEPDHSSDDYRYYALVLKKKDAYPQVIRLDITDNLNKDSQEDMIQNNNSDQIYSKVWKHIEGYLDGIKDVYISPIGILNSISYIGVKNDKGEYISDSYTIHNVISTRDIAKIKKTRGLLIRDVFAVLFGGADFGLPASSCENINDSLSLSQNLLFVNTRGQGVDYLPESKQEVLDIYNIIKNRAKATVYNVGDKATKRNFIYYSKRSPGLLHISTHGFYFPKDKSIYNKTMSIESNFLRISNNPLMRCGLLFSGANHLWQGDEPSEGFDNGILTAYEISKLNLSETKLIVLSACDTGLGDIDYNEGIYGLQRAFRLAGAESMIVSLRKVPDKETRELITSFYNYWVSGLEIKKAFDKAQKSMRGKYPDNPEKWNDFILIE